MTSIESISEIAKNLRIAFWSILVLIAACILGLPNFFGYEVEPMANGAWLFSAFFLVDSWLGVDESMTLADLTPEPTVAQTFLIALIFLALTSVILFLILQIDGLFKRYRAGEIFTTRCARCFRYIGFGLIAFFLLNGIGDLYLNNYVFPDGVELIEGEPEMFTVANVVLLDFSLLLAGLFMLAVAYVMQLGAQLQDDVDGTI